MYKGTAIVAIDDYDLFDLNIKGEVGIYLKTDSRSGKHLIYFPKNGEYAELLDEQIKEVDASMIPPGFSDFADRTRTLGFETTDEEK